MAVKYQGGKAVEVRPAFDGKKSEEMHRAYIAAAESALRALDAATTAAQRWTATRPPFQAAYGSEKLAFSAYRDLREAIREAKSMY